MVIDMEVVMGTYLTAISALTKVCDTDERELIEEMIFNAADYVQVVTTMETKRANYVGRQGADLREVVTMADSARSKIHNSLIARVNAVNRICDAHGLPRLYNGDEQRRHYGDFAIELVNEIFTMRL